MNSYKDILDKKEDFYSLAITYYYNIDQEYIDHISRIVPKSISLLIDHEFIPTPCIEIKLQLHHKEENEGISSYYLYVNEKKEFIDEFLH
ncbi:hypothetical protein LPB87_19190 [Flavobacterium sp. EDS]|uniref:hypothetical protein n=1 Tax=Flavobacterium sp. EDS TaxID=2897328 RepID=UPI001E3D26FD|nr:hypothetical protein [Flavobacterium sp. EDS]MCD0476525.1 hypothetical protein [Flavobacterium sp. EDS]